MTKIRLPGRRLALPSSCLLYTNGEVTEEVFNTGEVEIHPINTINEIRLKSPDLLFGGHAIAQVISECVPGILKPLELLAKDVDAIMLFLRVVTFGANFSITAKHNCKHAQNHTYEINLETIISGGKYLTKEEYLQRFTVVIPNGQTVRLQPHRFNYVIELLQMTRDAEAKERASVDDAVKVVMSQLNEIVHSVDGITDRGLINEWISACPATWIEQIAKASEKAGDWGFDMSVKSQCQDCGGTDFKVALPMNPAIFFSN